MQEHQNLMKLGKTLHFHFINKAVDMYRLSRLEISSIMLITLNLIGINLVVLIKNMRKEKLFDIFFYPEDKNREKSQLRKVIDEGIVKVAIYDKTAYWVLNNVIYRASLNEDGKIDQDLAEEIDVFKLSEKEVNNLLTIIDSISE